EIKTSAFTLSPIYEKGNRLRPSGYRVRNTVVLKTKDLDRVGMFIDEASKAGADRIGSLTFGNDKEEQFRKEARVEALRDAMRNAEDLAKAAGLTIKRTLSISYAPRRAYMPRSVLVASAADTATPVEVGQIPIEATVNVIFEVN
ncbi:SIMPL domain-containing protein, partial [bacterium]|nr:SIMPL domain-containing protein [bacterium]